jgi:shikimate dehydrogenase
MFTRAHVADDVASRTGSVNTLRRHAGRWDGRNFDVAGFMSPLRRRGRTLAGARVVVLGAGGSARTAAWALKQEGARVEVAARQPARGQALAGEVGVGATTWPPPPGWDLLVNTTPVGTWPNVDEAPIAPDAVRGAAVYDLIYNPRETTLLRWAREAGAETIDGLEMLVGQARLQFEWWTGREAPVGVMEKAAEAFIARGRQRAA